MTREEKLAEAGSFVLGLLEGRELAAFEAARAADPELDAMVERLRARLLALDDTAQPEPVPAGLWETIAARLDDAPAQEASASATIVPLPVRTAPRRAVLGWSLAIAASLLATAAIGYMAASRFGDPGDPVAVAVLLDERDGTPGALVEAFGDDSVLLVHLQDYPVPAGQIMQLWTLPDPQTGPVSLGTTESAARVRLRGPDLPAPREGQLYEITLEPAPGSPTGRPTGPILVKGLATLVGQTR